MGRRAGRRCGPSRYCLQAGHQRLPRPAECRDSPRRLATVRTKRAGGWLTPRSVERKLLKAVPPSFRPVLSNDVDARLSSASALLPPDDAQAGSIGLLGLGMNHLAGLREACASAVGTKPAGRAKSCIYIFLSGGL